MSIATIIIDEGCSVQRYFNQYERGIKSPKKISLFASIECINEIIISSSYHT